LGRVELTALVREQALLAAHQVIPFSFLFSVFSVFFFSSFFFHSFSRTEDIVFLRVEHILEQATLASHLELLKHEKEQRRIKVKPITDLFCLCHLPPVLNLFVITSMISQRFDM